MSRSAPLLVLAVLLAAGCGGGGTGSREGGGLRERPLTAGGERSFGEAGCGSCHTLQAASARGTTGPNLDSLRPTREAVVRVVTNGANGMPAFRTELSMEEIQALAVFVARSAREGKAEAAATFTPDKTQLAQCGRQRFACVQQALGNISYHRGPRVALRLLERMQKDFPAPICHQITHTIGAGALARFGDVGEAFAYGSALCSSGYYHGILERALAAVPRGEVASVALELCAGKAFRRNGFMAFQCQHGLGHGLMLYSDYDLQFSLSICHRFRSKVYSQNCASGVFMENISSSYGVRSRWLKDDDPIYPCNAVAERDKLYCYLIVAGRILQLANHDWRRTSEICRRRSEAAWKAVCFQSIGGVATGERRFDPVGIVEKCRFSGDMRRECIFGAVRNVVNEDARASPRAIRLCRLAPASARSYCFYGIGTVVHWIGVNDQQRRSLCSPAGASYYADCLRGAAVAPAARRPKS